MILAAIFDMDGLLVNTEPFWRETEKEVFGKLGLTLTDAMCESTAGMRINEVVEHWFQTHPWETKSTAEVQAEIIDGMEQCIHVYGEAMEGVEYILNLVSDLGLRVALASASPERLIRKVLSKLDIHHRFEVVCSAEFEEKGKPDPAVYLTAARKLGVDPSQCIAFEDSYNGLRSARAAGMRTVAVPETHLYAESKYNNVSDLKLRSLKDFTEEHLRWLESIG